MRKPSTWRSRRERETDYIKDILKCKLHQSLVNYIRNTCNIKIMITLETETSKKPRLATSWRQEHLDQGSTKRQE